MTEKTSDATSVKWGSIKLAKLPQEIDINRLKQLRPIIADEPLLPSILSCQFDSAATQQKARSCINKY